MSFFALLEAELLLHRKSTRSRLVLLSYPLLTLAPWPIFLGLLEQGLLVGPATPLSLVLSIQPLTSLLLAAGIAGRGADRASREELLPLLTSSKFPSSLLVFGRALALAIFFLVATAIPFLVLGLFALIQGTPFDPLALVGAWLLQAWPMTTVMGWTWMALALLGGSDLAALLLLWFGGMLLSNLAQVVTAWDTSFDWPFLQFPAFYQQAAILLLRGEGNVKHWISLAVIASEGPADLRIKAEKMVVDLLPAAGLALLLLSFAVQRLGRCRADLVPRDFSWAPSLGRLRQALAGDARLGWEKWTVWLALPLSFFSLWIVERRADFFFAWGESRSAAEKAGNQDPPTDSSWSLTRLRLEADLGRSANFPDGRLVSRFEEDFVLRGEEISSHLAFSLNSFLELSSLEASSGGRRLGASVRRRYDRLFVELERPLAPGEELHLQGLLRGRPALPHIGLRPGYDTDTFAETWAQILRDPAGRRSMRLAATQLRPAISRTQVRLAGQDLLPIPRYRSWQPLEIGQPTLFTDSRAEADPTAAETSLEVAPIELEILAPKGWQLFSSCAQQAEGEGERLVLRGICESRPAEFALRGGMLEVMTRGDVQIAALAFHKEASLPLLETLEEIHLQSEKSWPGATHLGKVVLIEETPYFGESRPSFQTFQSLPPIRSHGNLVAIAEAQLAAPGDLDPFELVGPLLVDRLLRGRSVVTEESWAVAAFLRAIVVRRLGLRSSHAVLRGPIWERPELGLPVTEYQGYLQRKGMLRLQALVADLEGRVGSTAIFLGVEDFLSERDEPGNLADLIAAIDRHSDASLARFAHDFLTLGALPVLELEDVASSPQSGGGFRIEGRLRNSASGEVFCPLLLRTERGEQWQKVRVGSESDASFTFETMQKPLLLELDPAQTCLRYETSASTTTTKVTL